MEKRVCEVCGEEFEPRRKDQRGCSAACAREIKRRDNREYRRIQRGSEKKYDAIGDAIHHREASWDKTVHLAEAADPQSAPADEEQ